MASADVDDEAFQLVNALVNAANDQFSMKMFLEAVKAEPESLVLSAYSVFTPLSLLSLIADGPTHEEILNTVGFQNDLSLISSMTIENSHLHTAEGIDIKTANKLFLPNDVDVDEEFAIKNNIVTELEGFDHTKPVRALANINKWVADQTDNRIDFILSHNDIDKDSKVIIANALYFKADWEIAFEENNTHKGIFHVTETEQKDVMYMFQGDRFGYSKSDVFNSQILELPYVNHVASLVIILPNEINGLAALQDKIKDSMILRKAITDLPLATIGVTIPKFQIETTQNLQDILQKIGIKTLFSTEANLSKLLKHSNSISTSVSKLVDNSTIINLSKVKDDSRRTSVTESVHHPKWHRAWSLPYVRKRNKKEDGKSVEDPANTSPVKPVDPAHTNPIKPVEETANIEADNSKSTKLFVSKAIQKSFISVDEAGKKAAAVKEATLLGEDDEVAYRLNFKADHPFVFLIKQGDLILFTGVYKS